VNDGSKARDEVAERAAALRARIAAAAQRAGRDPGEVVLVGVAKGQPLDRVEAAVRAGVARLGENYVQEARARQEALAPRLAQAGLAAPSWHFVGRLQRNKAREAVRLFDCIETVDSAPLAAELDRRAAVAGRRLAVLLQVNLSREPQKGGVAPQELPALLAGCAGCPALRVTGLMTVPAASADPEASRPVFAQLRELRDTLLRAVPGREGGELRELSMGMSEDFEVAIEEGATIVRIGTALFGPRAPGRGAR
jgi:pyridoxal phosphate enzyme (YggS family)